MDYIFETTCGPKLDYGLEQRLRKLDRNLRVTYSEWCIDAMTRQPIISEETGKPIHFPAQYLWRWDASLGRSVWINWFPMIGGGFGHYNARCLEIDKKVTETHKPEEIFRLMNEKRKISETRAKEQHFADRKDRALANKKRIGDLVFHGKSGYRTAKVSSYPGQKNHSSSDRVLSDAREDGWEL